MRVASRGVAAAAAAAVRTACRAHSTTAAESSTAAAALSSSSSSSSSLSFLPRAADEAALVSRDAVPMSYVQAVRNALDVALRDSKTLLFGEDVAFGGVFRATLDLQATHGVDKVFNTPLSEQGIAAFAIGLAALGWRPVAEMQFADYIFPALDQIVNEAAKVRYRSGGTRSCGVTFRAPCGAVGHGGLYHSQSVEAYFAHCAGLKIVMPSSPADAKGLLLSCIADDDPCLFFEPKLLYRSAVEDVSTAHYTLPLGRARVLRAGDDVTVVTYGAQVHVAAAAAATAAQRDGIAVELIDLRTLQPWDRECVAASVRKTGRVLVTHEASQTCGYGAELCASIASDCFTSLEAPPLRVCGLDTPVPLRERLYLPNEHKLYEAIKRVARY